VAGPANHPLVHGGSASSRLERVVVSVLHATPTLEWAEGGRQLNPSARDSFEDGRTSFIEG
jgi:hypothetical protein